MEFINENLLAYCETHSAPESPLLKELNRETHLKVKSPRMLSGHLQGRFLAMLSHLLQPKNVLEVGTYTGYSALCLAEGIQKDGKLITIDPNEETNEFAAKYISHSEYHKVIQIRTGQAQTVIPALSENFDIVFIDADKKNYGLYFDLTVDKVRKGGLIIADNVLWSGKVLDRTQDQDKDTSSLVEFNRKVAGDARVACLMLPVRDGLTIMRKL